MKTTNPWRVLRAIDTSNRRLVVSSLAVWVLFFVIPVFAQSGHAAEDIANPTSPEAMVGSEAQDGNTPNQEAQEQSPILKSDENSIPGKPSIFLSESSRLTFGDRLSLYRRSVFTPEIFVGPAFAAGVNQLRNDPPEWMEGGVGYGRRFGSGLARNVISRTIVFGFAAADGEDPRYIRSEGGGFGARTRHAIAWTFITRNQSGARMPAFSRIVGAFGAGFAANNWYPSRENNTAHALRMGSTALASSVGFHILSEFWPDIKKTIHLGSHEGRKEQ